MDRFAALEHRIARIERMVARDGPLVAAVGDAMREIRTQIESTRLKFLGVHEIGRSYEPGSLVVRSGSLWHCNEPTRDTPGKSNAWQLAVKQGEPKKEPTVR